MADDRVDFNGNAMLVGPSNDGDILRLGDTGAYASGFFAVQFYDAQVDEGPSFTGTIIPVATPRKWDSPESGGNIPFNATQRAFEVPFIPIPYRIVILNGVPWDVTLPNQYVIAGTAITTTSMIEIPANGLSIGLQVQCSSGSGWLYRLPLVSAVP